MEEWELIICYSDMTWDLATVEVCLAHIDNEEQVKSDFLKNYKGTKAISFIGVYSTTDIEDNENGDT